MPHHFKNSASTAFLNGRDEQHRQARATSRRLPTHLAALAYTVRLLDMMHLNDAVRDAMDGDYISAAELARYACEAARTPEWDEDLGEAGLRLVRRRVRDEIDRRRKQKGAA